MVCLSCMPISQHTLLSACPPSLFLHALISDQIRKKIRVYGFRMAVSGSGLAGPGIYCMERGYLCVAPIRPNSMARSLDQTRTVKKRLDCQRVKESRDRRKAIHQDLLNPAKLPLMCGQTEPAGTIIQLCVAKDWRSPKFVRFCL